MQDDTDINQRNTIASMIEIYHQEVARTKAAYGELKQAQNNLKGAFGNQFSEFSTLPERIYDADSACKEVQRKLKKNAWRALINILEIRKVLSVKRALELDKRLDDPDLLPEITHAAVYEMFDLLVSNSKDFAQEAVYEVYDFLRPHSEYSGAKYKTNQKNARVELGRKIIMTSMLDNVHGGGFRVNYHNDIKLIALDNVFHLIEGKGHMGGYRSPLIDAINTCDGGKGETDYFRFKCYQNRNLHLEFKRLDLLMNFNAIAGGMNLKPGES
jgi:hypothetical protein